MAHWDFDMFDWDPWHDFERLRRRMNALFGRVAGEVLGGPFPPVNVWSDDEKAVVTAEVPGVRKEDLDISVENDALTLKGSREPEEISEGERYRRRERGRGSFSRMIPLPFPVQAEGVEASYKNGVLTVTLPRAEASKPKKIEIKG